MPEPIRVLHMIGNLSVGGSQVFVMNIFRNIDRSKVMFDFVVDRKISGHFTDEVKALGGKIYYIPTFSPLCVNKLKKNWDSFFKTHKEYKIIHSHVRSYASIYLKIAKDNRLHTIIHSHSTSNGSGISALVKAYLQKDLGNIADYKFACSEKAGKWLFGENTVNDKNFHIIKNAISTEQFRYNEDARKNLRHTLNIDDKFVIGHVGRFHESKNHKFLIDVFCQIKKQEENSVLLSVGEGELLQNIKEYAKDKGVQNDIIFLGIRDDIPDCLSAMDVFLFPSIYEGLGISAVEAQCSGLPCILSENIPSEVVCTKDIAFLPFDEKLWADEALSFKDFKRKDASVNVASCGYDIKNVAGCLENFYLTLGDNEK